MQKVVVVISNCLFNAYIAFHGVLYGFLASHGTDTTSLEAKLIQKLMAMKEEVLYAIYMDLHKAYDALDRDICLEILEWYSVEGCDVGPQAHCILCSYWDRLWMMACAGGYYRADF